MSYRSHSAQAARWAISSWEFFISSDHANLSPDIETLTVSACGLNNTLNHHSKRHGVRGQLLRLWPIGSVSRRNGQLEKSMNELSRACNRLSLEPECTATRSVIELPSHNVQCFFVRQQGSPSGCLAARISAWRCTTARRQSRPSSGQRASALPCTGCSLAGPAVAC